MSDPLVLTLDGELKGYESLRTPNNLGELAERLADTVNSLEFGLILIGFEKTPDFWPKLGLELRKLGVNWLKIKYIDAKRDPLLMGNDFEESVENLVNAWSAYLRASPELTNPSTVTILSKAVSRRHLIKYGPMVMTEICSAPKIGEKECASLKYCDLCLESCPYEALKGKPPQIIANKCVECGLCVNHCPKGLISDPTTSYKGFHKFLLALNKEVRNLVITCPKTREKIYYEFDHAKDSGVFSGTILYETSCIPALSIHHLITLSSLGIKTIFYCPSDLLRSCKKKEAVKEYLKILKEAKEVIGLEFSLANSIDQMKIEQEYKSKLLSDDRWIPLNYLPFFRIVIDSNRCTLCGSCSNICPEGAITMAFEKSVYTLLMNHSKCIGCRFCQIECPEGAIVILRQANPRFLFDAKSKVKINEGPVAKCVQCGRILGPEAMISRMEKKMREKKLSAKVIELIRLCEECRRKRSLDTFQLSVF